MKKRSASVSQMSLFPVASASADAMTKAFAALPRPTRPGCTVLHIAVTADQRAVIDRAVREAAKRRPQQCAKGVDAGSPAAVADALTDALTEWLAGKSDT